MFEFEETPIAGLVRVRPTLREDPRGLFVKTFHTPFFEKRGMAHDFAETFFSTSSRSVLRGMHFQAPPHDHAKLVYCVDGDVLDVVVDLRRSSPTFGRSEGFKLEGDRADGLYVPAGCAHGFLSLSQTSLMLYAVTTVHSPSHDAGVRWDSVGFDWPTASPILSPRDATLPRLEDLVSPFS